MNHIRKDFNRLEKHNQKESDLHWKYEGIGWEFGTHHDGKFTMIEEGMATQGNYKCMRCDRFWDIDDPTIPDVGNARPKTGDIPVDPSTGQVAFFLKVLTFRTCLIIIFSIEYLCFNLISNYSTSFVFDLEKSDRRSARCVCESKARGPRLRYSKLKECYSAIILSR